MKTRRINLLLLPAALAALVAGLCLSETVSLAQSDTHDPLLIVPPPVPRYRKTRPAIEVKADQAEQTVPIPVYPPAPAEEVPEVVPKPWVTTPAQLAKKRARYQIIIKQESALERRDQFWANVGKVAAFLLVSGVGIFCLTDISRQIRKAKQVAAMLKDEEEDE